MLLQPRQALNKAYLKVKPNRTGIEAFKQELIQVLDSINEHETEEHHKNLLSRFLSKVWYEPNHFINTKGRSDLVIHNGRDGKSSVGVIIEAKRPGKGGEMLRQDNLNTKAFHELLLYYLRERITHNNLELKHLVATNTYEWFIFDAQLFEKLFAQDKKLVKNFTDFEEGRLGGKDTSFFYKEIAAPVTAANMAEIAFAHFDIRTYDKVLRNASLADDTKLIALYKLLSPQHLLKQPFANDSNTLDRGFYSELLHIIGLTETKEGSKKVIGRPKEAMRQPGSLLENTINQLDSRDKISRLANPRQYGETYNERLYTVALELVITWVNRILFLKLLEAQLMSYHRFGKSGGGSSDGIPHGSYSAGNSGGSNANQQRDAIASGYASDYAFLNSGKIHNFDDLDSLFFEVLAKKPEQRNAGVNKLFGRVPYLNSSLFEPTDLEHDTLFIGNLRDERELQVPNNTVLRDNNGRKLSGSLSTLHYFFEFLNAYDFSSEGSEEIQEENKTLINASVLGLIFEKINGYKDGSFFTPGFITMYMCRETIQRALVQKFNEHYPDWNCESFAELCNRTGRLHKPEQILEANKVVNSLRICDPAVGSGHFLVSALNELIACKHQLGLLADATGKLLNGYEVTVENDELTVTYVRGGEPELFAYHLHSAESQRVQETLFHEKQTIIEQCLFGVDINPNSVKICRLRLWIELLKNAYYKCPSRPHSDPSPALPLREGANAASNVPINQPASGSAFSLPKGEGRGGVLSGEVRGEVLETLPNIDINIKTGNSLISRFALDADLKQALKKSKYSIDSYRAAVQAYHHAADKEQKRELERLIRDIKSDFRTEIGKDDPKVKRLQRLGEELYRKYGGGLFTEKLTKAQRTDRDKLQTEAEKLKTQIEEIKSNRLYENAFEWRFEFPEVLNQDGDFVGFDVVIGNPPYIRQEELSPIKPYLQSNYASYAGTADLFVYFIERGFQVLKQQGHFAYIVPNKWLRAGYGKALRQWLLQHNMQQLIDFGDLPVFEEATTYPLIIQAQKQQPAPEAEVQVAQLDTLDFDSLEIHLQQHQFCLPQGSLQTNDWNIGKADSNELLTKLKQKGTPLGEYVNGKIFYGIKTGLNEAFVIDEATKEQLIAEDPKSAEIIKPFLAGRDIKRYLQPLSDKYLFFIPKGFTRQLLAETEETDPWQTFAAAYPAIAKFMEPYAARGKKRLDKGEFWWELRACIYYDDFERNKIIFQEIATYQAFTWSNNGEYCNNKIYIIPGSGKEVLALLNSKVTWYFLNQIASKLQGGAFALQTIYTSQIPVPDFTEAIKTELSNLVSKILDLKKADPKADTTKLEAEIDRLVYAIYGLSEEEIGLVEGK